MDATRKLVLLIGATSVALLLLAGPAVAVDDPPADDVVEAPVEDEGRIALVEGPRDAFFLLMWAALIVGGGLAVANARRQLKGERPQASGEFRWR